MIKTWTADFEDDQVYKRDIDGHVLRGMDLDFLVWVWNANQTARIPWIVEGPMKTFDVRYLVYDGCGNVDKEIITVMAVDKKASYTILLQLKQCSNDQRSGRIVGQ